MDKNLLLYLPFDDPDGSTAYDYSAGRHDVTISDGAFLSKQAIRGKSLNLCGGEAVTKQEIPFNGDFTITLYIQIQEKHLGWLLNLPDDQHIEKWIDVIPNDWYFLAFVRERNTFRVYLNSECISHDLIKENPTGFSIFTDELLTTTAKIDEVRIFDIAKTKSEIIKMQADTDVEYFIDGVNFKEFGVYVSASDGLIGRLAQKDSLSMDYNNYHGVVRDYKNKRYKARTISLKCFIEAESRSALIEKKNSFLSLFDTDKTQRLTVEYDGSTRPLVYEVGLYDETPISKKWSSSNNGLMIGTFTIKLIEDEPVKKVLRHVSAISDSEVTITTTTTKLLNVYWGDGTHTFNVHGNNTTIKHTYTHPGEYDIIITGVIEDIEKFETNAIVVWELLK